MIKKYIINYKLQVYYMLNTHTENYVINHCFTFYNKKITSSLGEKLAILSRYNEDYILTTEEPPNNFTQISGRIKCKMPKQIDKDFNEKKILKLMSKDTELLNSKLFNIKANVEPDKITYKKYLLTSKWKKIAKNISKRDNGKCRICNSQDNLECHHLTYENLFNEKDEDLITLCKDCHTEEHNKIKKINKTVNDYYLIKENNNIFNKK